MTSPQLNLFSQSAFAWTALLVGLLLLLYTGLAVKNEKRFYLSTGKPFEFGQFIFFLPSWWECSPISPTQMNFVRKDASYDWKATFELWEIPDRGPLEELLLKKVEEWEIVFDQDVIITKNENSFRMEGTATFAREERLYLDFFLTRDDGDSFCIFLSSWSSVLTGMIEGPYFEEVIKSMTRRKP